jgi:hypothetical protein
MKTMLCQKLFQLCGWFLLRVTNYEDALLGLGWTAIKARQWKDCIDAGQKLAQVSSRFVMQGEGALLQAYGNMLQKQYEQRPGYFWSR